VQLIVEQGNDYLVGVKGNQPKLLQQFKKAAGQQLPRSIDIQTERTRERVVERTVKVFEANCALTSDWAKAQSLIEVQRRGTRAHEPFEATSYYLSSLSVEAVEFALGIRCHRDIENGLHWVKDVVLKEDAAPFVHSTAATNWSIIRTIVLNLVRHWGYRSLSKAQRFLSHDLDQLFHLLTIN
jgi:predicted transposase YbfD/YdcC